MSCPAEISSLDSQLEATDTNPKENGYSSSVKRTPLQTLSPNSPSLLLRSRGYTKRRSPLFDRFVQVSQSTPLYRPDAKCSIAKDTQEVTPLTPENHVEVSQSTPFDRLDDQCSTVKDQNISITHANMTNDVITESNLSEVSVSTSHLPILEDISLPVLTNSGPSLPSLGQIEMPYESFDIHMDPDELKSPKDICSTCDNSIFNATDNKENHDVPDYLYEDISSDNNDDFLFHSRNSDSKVFLALPLEDDLDIEILDEVKAGNPSETSTPSVCHTSSSNKSMCQTSSSNLSEWQTSTSSLSESQTSTSQFGDNEESCEAAFKWNDTAEKDISSTFEKELAFACSLDELQYLIENGMFLDSPTDDPRYEAGASDGYIPATLEAYEPEEGETDNTDESSAVQLEETSDSSGESLSPGEIGSSLFSDNSTSSTCSSHSRNSSTSSNQDLDFLQTSSSLKMVESESQESSSNSNISTEVTKNTSDTDLDGYNGGDDENFKTAKIFSNEESTSETPVYFKDYQGVFEDLFAEMEESRLLTTSSTCIQSGEPALQDVVGRSAATSRASDEKNWSPKVHTDSLHYQNEVDIWDCHALQEDLVDYFGATDTYSKNNNPTGNDVPPETPLALQDLKDITEVTNQVVEIFETVDNVKCDSEYGSVKEHLDTSYEVPGLVIEGHAFGKLVAEENVELETQKAVANPANLNSQNHSLHQSCSDDQVMPEIEDHIIHNFEIHSKETNSLLATASEHTKDLVHAPMSVENLGYIPSDSSDDANDEDYDNEEWDNISYDDEDCLHEGSEALVDNFVSCTEDVSLIGNDDKEIQTVKALTAVKKEENDRLKSGSHLEASLSHRRSTYSAKWSCMIL